MDRCSRYLQISVLILVAGGLVHAQGNSTCAPLDAFLRLLGCLDKIIPDLNHPIYAPIIGGADKEYAKDMCRSDQWLTGLQCLRNLFDQCMHDKRVHTFLTSFMTPKKLRDGRKYFCDHLQEHFHYIECYKDHRDALSDCYLWSFQKVSRYFLGRGADESANQWIKFMCGTFRGNADCQSRAMTEACGRPAGQHLRTITMQFYPDRCGAATLSAPALLATLLAWALSKLSC